MTPWPTCPHNLAKSKCRPCRNVKDTEYRLRRTPEQINLYNATRRANARLKTSSTRPNYGISLKLDLTPDSLNLCIESDAPEDHQVKNGACLNTLITEAPCQYRLDS